MRKILILLLCLCICSSIGIAEIPCECHLPDCTCFIQLGDGGPELEYIQHALIEQGYLNAKHDADLFDEYTQAAVMQFQEAHQLPVTGILDDDTLTLLLWGMLPHELDKSDPTSNSRSIGIPTDGGKRRHVRPTCSKMADPRLVSVRNADKMNMLPCGRCNKNGCNE